MEGVWLGFLCLLLLQGAQQQLPCPRVCWHAGYLPHWGLAGYLLQHQCTRSSPRSDLMQESFQPSGWNTSIADGAMVSLLHLFGHPMEWWQTWDVVLIGEGAYQPNAASSQQVFALLNVPSTSSMCCCACPITTSCFIPQRCVKYEQDHREKPPQTYLKHGLSAHWCL